MLKDLNLIEHIFRLYIQYKFIELRILGSQKFQEFRITNSKLTVNKIGGPIFSVYGLSASKDFKVQFIDENAIGLSAGNPDPKASSVRYVRIVEEQNN